MALNKAQKVRRYVLARHGQFITARSIERDLRTKVSRSTIIKVLNLLDVEGAVQRRGKGRSVRWYVESQRLDR